jgi:hypothetical protein
MEIDEEMRGSVIHMNACVCVMLYMLYIHMHVIECIVVRTTYVCSIYTHLLYVHAHTFESITACVRTYVCIRIHTRGSWDLCAWTRGHISIRFSFLQKYVWQHIACM